MYSGLAEAYGIYTVLSFFLQYMYHHPLLPQQRRPLYVYCDNKGVIDRICNRTNNIYPRNAIQDNYPIYAKIDHCLQQLQPLDFHFIHVLGHQDKHPDKQLTIPKCLNIDCDIRASSIPTLDNPVQLQLHPCFAASYPHLCIHGQIIIHRLQATLGMLLPKVPTSNICRTNSNGQHYQLYRSNGRLSSWHFDASTDLNAKLSRSLFTNGSPCKIDIKSTAHLPITHAHPATVPPKPWHISSPVHIPIVKPFGPTLMPNYSNTSCTTRLTLCIMICSTTD